MNPPKDVRDRVEAEHQELLDRIEKLSLFILTGAPGASMEEADLLARQLEAMLDYSEVLHKRKRLWAEEDGSD